MSEQPCNFYLGDCVPYGVRLFPCFNIFQSARDVGAFVHRLAVAVGGVQDHGQGGLDFHVPGTHGKSGL